MAIRANRNDPWHGPSSSFQPNEGPARDSSDQFAPLDLRGTGLRGFVERELQSRAATSSGTNLTLIPGKLYLRQLPNGSWELLVYRGRSCYDAYPGESAEELIEFAKTLIKEQ
jgi:hypothetical protein